MYKRKKKKRNKIKSIRSLRINEDSELGSTQAHIGVHTHTGIWIL